MTKLEDLKLVLEAIKATRARWIKSLESRISEILTDDPKKNYNQAFSQAISHKEVNEEFQNLITLYGVIGSDAAAYSQALSQDVGQNAQVIRLPKKAA